MASSWQSPADKVVEALYEHPRNYVSCMKSTGHGHPIWHFRGQQYTEFSIGDIGFWHDEWFPVHINISRAAPSIFSVTQVSPKTPHYPISKDKILRFENVIQPLELISPQSVATEVPIPSDTDSYQASTSEESPDTDEDEVTGVHVPVRRRRWSLQVDGQAALLYLPDGAYREYIEPTAELRHYLDSNWDLMYHYAYNKQRVQFPKDEFCCALGLVRAPRWAAVSLKGHGRAEITATCAEYMAVKVVGEGEDLTSGHTAEPNWDKVWGYRMKPKNRTRTMTEIIGDFIVFANLYQLKKRPLFGRWKMKASAEPQDPNAGDGQDSTPGVTSGTRAIRDQPDPTQQYHALRQVLLDYILEASDARSAFAGDSDVLSLFPGYIPADFAAHLKELRPKVIVDRYGIGTVTRPKDYAVTFDLDNLVSTRNLSTTFHCDQTRSSSRSFAPDTSALSSLDGLATCHSELDVGTKYGQFVTASKAIYS